MAEQEHENNWNPLYTGVRVSEIIFEAGEKRYVPANATSSQWFTYCRLAEEFACGPSSCAKKLSGDAHIPKQSGLS